jgi:hypothetical protein
MEDTEINDPFLKHELLDRIHCINVMFAQLVAEHPAAVLLRAEIDAIDAQLAELYQQAGGLPGVGT